MVTDIQVDKYRTKDIEKIDLKNAFFHYTNIHNLDSIFNKGLEPQIGKNSKGIEKSNKVFFTMGDEGVLVLMDAWLKWLILRPTNQYVYELGAYLMTKKFFPTIIIDTVFKNWIRSNRRSKKACNKLKNILDNSVFLILDLEENIDFDFNDIDEIKNQNF